MTQSQASKNKRKGADWELSLLDYFRRMGLVAERMRLAGKNDEGDLMVYLDAKTVLIVEAKNEQSFKAGTWINEANIEAANWTKARSATVTTIPVVISKRRQNSVGKAYVIMELDTYMEQVAK